MENKNTNIDILDILDIDANKDKKEELLNFDLLEEIKVDENLNIKPEENIEVLENTNNDILNSDIFSEYEENEATLQIEQKSNKIKDLFKFIFSYISTSGAIFVLLIVGTNYSAYFEIAKSYINADEIARANAQMAKSLEATKIVDPEEAELNSAKKQEETENKNYHSMTKLIYEANNENVSVDIDITPYENRIIIPKIGKNIPLVNVENKQVTNVKELEDVFMEELSRGVIRYPGSGIPGENGNMFVFGHSSNFPWIKGDYNDVFATLDKVVFNDIIIVYYNQKKYTYKIREKTVIKPGDVSILKRNEGKSEISIMTCYPIGTSINRLIVIGELVPNE